MLIVPSARADGLKLCNKITVAIKLIGLMKYLINARYGKIFDGLDNLGFKRGQRKASVHEPNFPACRKCNTPAECHKSANFCAARGMWLILGNLTLVASSKSKHKPAKFGPKPPSTRAFAAAVRSKFAPRYGRRARARRRRAHVSIRRDRR